MKVLLVVFFMCIHSFCTTVGFFGGSKQSLNFTSLERAVKNKCVTEENFKQLKVAFNEFSRCSTRSWQDHHPIQFNHFDINQDYCSYFDLNKFHMCLENLTTNISPCLAENEMYLQKFIHDAFDVAHEELCGINGLSNIEYLFDVVNRTGECLQICHLLFVQLGACNTAHLNIFKHLDGGVLNLNKQDVCSDLEALEKCTTQVMDGVCNEEYARFTNLIFYPFFKNCNNLDSKK